MDREEPGHTLFAALADASGGSLFFAAKPRLCAGPVFAGISGNAGGAAASAQGISSGYTEDIERVSWRTTGSTKCAEPGCAGRKRFGSIHPERWEAGDIRKCARGCRDAG